MLNAVRWRAGLLAAKATGQRPLVPWSVIWTEITQNWNYTFTPPEFKVVEEDAQAQLVCLQVGDDKYWMPDASDLWGLGSMYRAVFNPKQPHYYEFGGCKINPGDVVLDAGACEGFFTRFALQRGARVIAVEPWSRMAEGLERTYAKEIQAGQVVIERALLTDTNGQSYLGFNPDWPYGANEASGDLEEGHHEAVAQMTVDSLMEKVGWGPCGFIKMDIEGAEPRAVAGARETLKKHHPNLAIAVYHRASDYVDVVNAMTGITKEYQVSTKGIIKLHHEPVYRPRILHAWHPSKASRAHGAS